MRTKTLLVASAVALTAAITSSQAQTVYSANIVGYVNQAVPSGQYAMLSAALDSDGTGTNGTISSVVGTNVDVGTQVLSWTGSGYNTLIFTKSGKGASATTFWALSGVVTNNYPLNVGQGFFMFDPTTPQVGTNITQTGNVLQGTLVNNNVSSVAGTYSMLGSEVPLAGDLSTNLGYAATVGDQVLTWNGTGYTTYIYTKSGKGSAATQFWAVGGVPQEPIISVGQGFFLFPINNNESWSETFTNN
jgi:hypothetical protein